MLSKKLVLAAGAVLLLSTSGATAQSAAARAVLSANPISGISAVKLLPEAAVSRLA
jgi:hypothetical protein